MSSEDKFEVEEKSTETFLIAGHRMKGKYGNIGEGFKILCKEIGRHINGKAMSLYFDSEYKESGADFETCFPIQKRYINKIIRFAS